MGLLDKLWDETLAGPAPDSGLGKLRKYSSFSSKFSSAPPPVVVPPPPHDDSVSRRITDLRNNTPRNLSVSVDSPPPLPSPSGPTTPSSPFSPTTPGGNFKKLTRRKSTSAAPTGYDWIVLSSLDR